MKPGYHGPLERVGECCWKIPRSYKPGMRVDGLIYASEALIEKVRLDQAAEQVANVATLPGIQVASLAMPDIHWGYGFPIGGVAAMDPDQDGVISPGGVGYDINCLAGDSAVLHEYGYTRPIRELAEDWRTARVTCMALGSGRIDSAGLQRWFGRKSRSPVLLLRTESGDEIRATADHPFWTPGGMIEAGRLRPGDRVALSAFRGVPYERPSGEVIVSEEMVAGALAHFGKGSSGNALGQTLRYLRSRGLVPLRYDSPALPRLCKVLGFVLGDGSIHRAAGDNKAIVSFSGESADLESVRADIAALGLRPSRIYTRERKHRIRTEYRQYEFATAGSLFQGFELGVRGAARLPGRAGRGEGRPGLRRAGVALLGPPLAEAALPLGAFRRRARRRRRRSRGTTPCSRRPCSP